MGDMGDRSSGGVGDVFGCAVSAPPDVLVQVLPDDEAVFLDLASESYFGLDAVGTRMYRALLENATVQEAFEQLSAEFEVAPEQLRGDLERFARDLHDKRIIRLHAP